MIKNAVFVLIDGHAILYRAFHALPSLTTSKGELVNAVFGFTSMLLRINDELKPTLFAVCFDLPKPTFRKKLFVDYQIQRPKMVEELSGQIKTVKKVINALGIPIYEKEGYEADDVLGTLANQANTVGGSAATNFSVTTSAMVKNAHVLDSSVKNDGSLRGKCGSSKIVAHRPAIEVIIVTGDRDLLQLVNDQTKVYMLLKGLTEAALYDEAKVEEKYGLKPSQIPDYKALIGDQSDNYPGVLGIGPKTAVNLLQKFVSLKNIYKHLEEIASPIAEKLKKDKKNAELSHKLATIVCDVPVRLDFKKAKVESFDKLSVRKLFTELEFKSLIPRLVGKKEKTKAARINPNDQSGQIGLF